MAGFGGPKITVDPSISTEQWIETKPGIFQTRHPRTGQPYGGEFIKQPDGKYTPYSLPAKVGSLFDQGIESGMAVAEGAGRGLLGMERGGNQDAYSAFSVPNPASMTAKGLGKMPGMLEGVAGVGMVYGPLAKGTLLEKAHGMIRKLQGEGKSMEEIRQAMPELSMLGVGGKKVGVELSDAAAHFTKDMTQGPFAGSLGDILKHDTLFTAYPEAKGIKTRINIDPSAAKSARFAPDGSIEITTNSAADARSTLLHEVQHWVQDKELWPTGGAPDSMRVGPGKYETQIKSVNDNLARIKAQDRLTNNKLVGELEKAEPDVKRIEELQRMQQGYAEATKEHQRKLGQYQQLEKYKDTPQGRHAAYADLWGERSARATADRSRLTQQQLVENPIQDYVDRGILENDRLGASHIPFQDNPIHASKIYGPGKVWGSNKVEPISVELMDYMNPSSGIPYK